MELLKRKLENNSNDKKREVAFAIMLLAYTIFGGYNLAVYTSGNCNMMPYQFTAMVISLISVLTFGWTALMTVGFRAESANEGLSQPTRIMRWFYFQSLNTVPIIAALVAVSLYISFLYCGYTNGCAKEQQNISGDGFCNFVKRYI
ncbi:hypothetical protein FRX31_018381 [Thalictrum thalictroides]|uniref:Uncharacterized protein n=1 Tax=Thalictrum thalictroides TaxID=46969 RepID=A0A7J6W656_THATH|nr:hypothetical protein FRX31_018381 [Thalictrum thalictroides]